MGIYLPGMLDEWLHDRLKKRQEEGLLRQLRTPSEGIDFASNDYLGLARSRELHENIQEACREFELNGATGSRLLSGTLPQHLGLEEELANRMNAESALLFASGYMANLGVLSSIPQRGDTILYDELSHASIKDGVRLSHARIQKFKHNDPEDLDRLLRRSTGNTFVVMESIYSMDGDTCNMEALIPIIKANHGITILDEAHATGVRGVKGNGLSGEWHMESDIDIRIYTFGKAMGVHGAAVVGSNHLVQYLINYSRPFIYTTAIPPAQLLGIQQAFHFLDDHLHLVEELEANIRWFLHETRNAEGYLPSASSIQGVIIPGNERCREVSKVLNEEGFSVFPVLSPTVPKGKERIRICLHSYNTKDQISALVSKIESLL